jgi:hypothetical protein
MDENLNPIYQIQLRRKEPDLVVWAIGDPNTPPKGTLDPDILLWCERYDFILVTYIQQMICTQKNFLAGF